MKQSDLKVSEKRQARKEKSKRRKKASRQIVCVGFVWKIRYLKCDVVGKGFFVRASGENTR